jgi:hypothetical protein
MLSKRERMKETKTHGVAIKSEAATDKKLKKNRKNRNLLSVTTVFIQTRLLSDFGFPDVSWLVCTRSARV